jgi:outer membrane receptor protein involved in Fe transport
LTGDLIQLPAGPLGIAIGAEWRSERTSYLPGPLFTSGTISLQKIDPTVGRFNVKEAFIEATVPLLKDLPLIDYLAVEGAYRIADYSLAGRTNSWKVGATYRPFSDLRLRTVLARAVRAPTISELFAGGSGQLVNVLDPCRPGSALTPTRQANCATFGLPPGFNPPAATSILQRFGGNPNLKPEFARTWTVGGVFTPSFLPGASLSIDYFKINIKDGMQNLPVQTSIDQCADTGQELFCSLITRDPQSGFLQTFQSTFINSARERISGVDIEASYSTSLGRLGDRLSLDFNYSHLFYYDFESLEGLGFAPFKGYQFWPGDRGTLRLSYDNGGLNLAVTQRYIGKTYLEPQVEFDLNEVAPEWYTDAQIRYTFDKRHSLYMGVNNLFDNDPPFVPLPYAATSVGLNTAATLYDPIGRFFYVGFSSKF